MLHTVWQDLKHGARMLRKNPAFSCVAMISIAIGVGANAAMFSMADALLLRPLSVPRANELVTVTAVVPRSGFASPTSAALSYPDYRDVRDQARSFSGLVAFRVVVASFADRPDQPAQRKFGMAVSGNLFDTLGVQPIHGRAIGVDDDRVIGRNPVVVLDNELWQQQFAGDPGVVGRRIRLGGTEMTVIGVMPSGFTGPDQFVQPAFYIPFAIMPSLTSASDVIELERRDVHNIAVKGRLKAGVSVEQAAEEVALIGRILQRAYPDTNRNQGLTARTEFDARVDARPPLAAGALMLMTLALTVLAVACANVAVLLTSRAPVRAREISLRLAIGAGRLRLLRQLIVESLLIAVGGGAMGLLLAAFVISLFQRLQFPTDVPLKLAFDLDNRVLIVGLIVAAISAVGSSLVPAWKSTRTDLVSHLKAQASEDPQRTRLWGRNLLVSGQVALSLVLLTIAVFLFRAYQSEYGRGPGFRTDHVLLMSFEPALAGYDVPRGERFYDQVKERASAIPGVRSVAFTSSVPFDGISIENTAVAPEGVQLPNQAEVVRVRSARVDEDYFDTLGIRIVEGRPFRLTDTASTPHVAVVNETFASRYWPNRTALGRRFRLIGDSGESSWVEIVGIAKDSRYRNISEAPMQFIYYTRRQIAAPISTLLLHTSDDPQALAQPLRAAVRAIDPNMPVFGVRSMEEFYRASSVSVTNLLCGRPRSIEEFSRACRLYVRHHDVRRPRERAGAAQGRHVGERQPVRRDGDQAAARPLLHRRGGSRAGPRSRRRSRLRRVAAAVCGRPGDRQSPDTDRRHRVHGDRRPSSNVPGANRPWLIESDEDSHPLSEVGATPPSLPLRRPGAGVGVRRLTTSIGPAAGNLVGCMLTPIVGASSEAAPQAGQNLAPSGSGVAQRPQITLRILRPQAA